MDELISRRALLQDIEEAVVFSGRLDHTAEMKGANKIIDRIKAAPAVDAVEVVRCYNCKQSERMSNPFGTVLHCHYWGKDVDYDGFCHEGY